MTIKDIRDLLVLDISRVVLEQDINTYFGAETVKKECKLDMLYKYDEYNIVEINNYYAYLHIKIEKENTNEIK